MQTIKTREGVLKAHTMLALMRLTQGPEIIDPPEYSVNDVFARDFRDRIQASQNQQPGSKSCQRQHTCFEIRFALLGKRLERLTALITA
ncbi:hypothetical protein J2W17_003754 [Pseudomonas lini]|nr:hypothetical protein [Pseudomonas lini]